MGETGGNPLIGGDTVKKAGELDEILSQYDDTARPRRESSRWPGLSPKKPEVWIPSLVVGLLIPHSAEMRLPKNRKDQKTDFRFGKVASGNLVVGACGQKCARCVTSYAIGL